MIASNFTSHAKPTKEHFVEKIAWLRVLVALAFPVCSPLSS